MRLVVLVIVVAIVYLLYSQGGGKQSPQSRVAEAQQEASLVQPAQPAPAPAAPAPSGNSIRAPIDRTRQVLELVKKRNGE